MVKSLSIEKIAVGKVIVIRQANCGQEATLFSSVGKSTTTAAISKYNHSRLNQPWHVWRPWSNVNHVTKSEPWLVDVTKVD